MTITIRHFVSTVADYGLDSKWKRHKPKFSGIVSLVPCKRRGGGGDHSIGSKMKLIFKWYIQGHWPLETWTSGYVGKDGFGWFFTLADADCLVAENGMRSNSWQERDKVNYTKYIKCYLFEVWSTNRTISPEAVRQYQTVLTFKILFQPRHASGRHLGTWTFRQSHLNDVKKLY